MDDNDPAAVTTMRNHIAALLVGGLLGQAERRGDYASYDCNPNGPEELVFLDTAIDPIALADLLIREIPGLSRTNGVD